MKILFELITFLKPGKQQQFRLSLILYGLYDSEEGAAKFQQ
jgi:hypothetical protein